MRATLPLSELPATEPAGPAFPRRHDLADLTTTTIAEMDRDELIAALRGADAPFLRPESYDRLEHWDLPTLRRVAHLARRCHVPADH